MTILVVGTLSSCSNEHDETHSEEHLHHLIDRVNAATDTVIYTITSDDFIGNIERTEVNEKGTNTFYVPTRTTELELFPCLNCHDRSIEKLSKERRDQYKVSHWNIEIKHASKETMNCFTCHNSDNLNQLHSITKQDISFDKSYNLCGQCHSTQKKEWLGGAHGKRIGGWAPPRTSRTCVNCHNPHSPAFESRWPSRLNKTKILQQEN